MVAFGVRSAELNMRTYLVQSDRAITALVVREPKGWGHNPAVKGDVYMYRIPKYAVQLVREKSVSSEVKSINQPIDVYNLMHPLVEMLPVEHFQIVMLDSKNKVIGVSMVTTGILNASVIHPREVFQRAILANCAAIILTHNHPSGDPAPSQDDISTTKKLVECGKVMEIPVLDHIVTGDGCYASMKAENII